jgi:dihydroorotase-like cyclic amidohydrolase
MISRSHNTPFHGRKVQGRILKTIVEGETRYEYGKAI